MPYTRYRCMLILCFGTAVAVMGCGGGNGGPKTVPVAGTITLNNQPLADAEVTFASENFSAFAKTDSDGHFALVQGAVPGKNRVSISKWQGEKLEMNADEGIDEGQLWSEMDAVGATAPNQPRQLIPSDYQDLEYIVPESGTETADFRLTAKE